jgi:hypothetical protein
MAGRSTNSPRAIQCPTPGTRLQTTARVPWSRAQPARPTASTNSDRTTGRRRRCRCHGARRYASPVSLRESPTSRWGQNGAAIIQPSNTPSGYRALVFARYADASWCVSRAQQVHDAFTFASRWAVCHSFARTRTAQTWSKPRLLRA